MGTYIKKLTVTWGIKICWFLQYNIQPDSIPFCNFLIQKFKIPEILKVYKFLDVLFVALEFFGLGLQPHDLLFKQLISLQYIEMRTVTIWSRITPTILSNVGRLKAVAKEKLHYLNCLYWNCVIERAILQYRNAKLELFALFVKWLPQLSSLIIILQSTNL